MTIFSVLQRPRTQQAVAQLQVIQQIIGIDLREDLAATIGGEATFALDGPMLPVPSWKLIVEVYDPATLIHTMERAVADQPEACRRRRDPGWCSRASDGSGRTYYTISREGLDFPLVFTTIDGYLVAAPSRAVIDQAIAYRAADVTLTGSGVFQSLLPDNGFTNCSALVYRDLGSLIDAIPPRCWESSSSPTP